ncbi:aspartate aminotransferase, mitochondrial [Angomonas deanei]|nr:aspartate aminotransferase, mitochondrial [Angomonas deanei]|eukprot:EPY35857.1 aspartate aminotransferase, mitochondrial [Angomonas deanei]
MKCSTLRLSLFSNVPVAPPDSIMGLSALQKKDPSPLKVNLAIGVYRDGEGKPFILESVKKAAAVVLRDTQMDYAPILGLQSYIDSTQRLCFGPALEAGRPDALASVQTLSGTGALRLAGDFLHRFSGLKVIHVPSPTYPNHAGIFGQAGIALQPYPYYNATTHKIDVDGMLQYLQGLEKNAVVLLHACAHNPTGCDLTEEVSKAVVSVCEKKQLVVLVDMAYQGFASGDIDRDALLPRLLAASSVPAFLIAQSFAKNFGLYGQRTGALHLQCATPKEKEAVLSQLSALIRPSYSNPPIFGARVVDTILRDQTLQEEWKKELKMMSDRLSSIRLSLVKELEALGCTRDFSHLAEGIGMMSLSGLSEANVIELRDKHHIYMTLNGRIAFSGLTSGNVKYVAEKIHEVCK